MPQNPPELPVRDFPTPEVSDGILVEIIDNDKGAYAIVPIGSRCPEGTDSAYVGYELVDVKTSGDFRWTYRYWANPSINQDVYNASISYSSESAAHPIYTRNYVERRPYTPRARGTTLTGVIGATVTAGGSAYDTPPAVTISGGGGSGATAEALLYRGAVVFVRILTEGTGYTTTPSINFASGAAAATALIQPQTAVLVKEDLGKLSEGDPKYGLYDLVVRIYETLPGPWIPFTRWDIILGPIQGQRRAVVNTGQAPSLTATSKTTYDAREGSSIVSWEIVETNSNGTGSPGNPAYPTLVTDIYDALRGAVQQVSQAVVATGSEVGSLIESGGTVTEITYEPINQFLLRKITETSTLAGPLWSGSQRSQAVRGRTVDVTMRLGTAAGVPVETGDYIISSEVDPISSVQVRRTTHSVASLPPTEVSAFWAYVPLPLLIFDINHQIFCNFSHFFTLVTNPDTGGGSSVLRKHRKTVSYHTSAPDPSLSSAGFTTADIRYEGRVIKFGFQNVLNDSINYSEEFVQSDGEEDCGWTEAYTLSATTPSATTFAAGAWYVKSFEPEPWGDSMWKATKIEYYSANGNPSI